MEFKGAEPALDNILKIKEITEKVHMQFSDSLEIEAAVQCFIATRFYFELELMPTKYSEYHQGTRYIYCHLTSKSASRQELLQQLKDSSARFLLNSRPATKRIN